MKQPARILFAVFAALAWCPTAAPQATANAPAVVAQDLKQLTVPDKISAALWTRRTDDYTLQLVYVRPSSPFVAETIARLRGEDPAQIKRWQPPEIQVWLLRPDGTKIGYERKSTPASSPQDQTPCEVLYSFSRSAARQASAVAVNIDGEYHVQQLVPFKD